MKNGKILKKLMFVLSVWFGLMLGSAWVSSFAEETTVDGIKYSYNPSTQTASVSTEQNTSISGTLSIPSSIEVDSISYAVTSIEDSAFENCSGLTDVTIWSGIETIGKNAFQNCSGLSGVTLSSGLKTIDESAFRGCTSLTNISFPNSLTVIGGYAFAGSGLTSVTIPGSVGANLSANAFNGCFSLSSVTLLSGVESIGDSAFKNCTSLTSVTIPHTVTAIESSAFFGCSNLQNVYLPENLKLTALVDPFKETAPANIWRYSVLSESEQTSAPQGKILVVICSVGRNEQNSDPLPTTINCTDMSSPYIVRSTKDDHISLVHNCGLKNTDTFTYIDDHNVSWTCTLVPNGKSSPVSVSIRPTDLSAISFNVEIPSIVADGCMGYKVTKIEDEAFSGCGLHRVTIAKGVTTIGARAFANCKNLTTAVVPTSVTSLGDFAFRNCPSLQDVFLLDKFDLTASTSPFEGSAQANLWRYRVIAESGDQGETTVEIKSVTKADGSPSTASRPGRFAMGTGYIIDNGAKAVGDTFTVGSLRYTVLSDGTTVSVKAKDISISGAIEIPSLVTYNGTKYTVTNIADSAFYACDNLSSITIPIGITSIGYYAFCGCSSLTSITIPESVTSIVNSAFSACHNMTAINVVSGNRAYSSQNGVLYNKNKTTLIQCPGGKTGSFTIPSGVTTIGDYAFSGCTSLTSVTIPSSVKSIGSFAFCGCLGLTSITIPEGVTLIGKRQFEKCSSLTNVYVKNGLDVSNAGIQSSANIWRYEVLDDQTRAPEGKTLVKVVSRDQGSGSTSVACDAMGEGYAINEVTASEVTLTHNSENLQATAAQAVTCTEAGHIAVYTCTDCGMHFSDASGTNAIAEDSWVIPAGHDWDEVIYTWAKDHSTCTAERTCKRDSSHVETETVTATSAVKTPATCETNGTATYTATFSNSAFEEQTQDVDDIPATGHYLKYRRRLRPTIKRDGHIAG